MLQTITHLQYWHHLIHLVSPHLQRNEETIRGLLKKKKRRNISKQKEKGVYYIKLQNVNGQTRKESFSYEKKHFIFQKMTDKARAIFLLHRQNIVSNYKSIVENCH